MALCVQSDSLARNGGSRWHVRLAAAPLTFLFAGRGPQAGGSSDDLLMKPPRRGGVSFEEALRQTRFLRAVHFVMARPPRSDIFLPGQGTTFGGLKPWQLSQKVVLRNECEAETDLSSKQRSRCGASPIFGFVCCRNQNSMAGAAFCERLPCVLRGGRNMFCAVFFC